MSLKRRRVGQNRQACRATGLIGCGKGRGVEVLTDQPLGRAGLLDLGDQGRFAVVDLRRDRLGEPSNGRRVAGICFDIRQRSRGLCRGDFVALVGIDFVENVGHGL